MSLGLLCDAKDTNAGPVCQGYFVMIEVLAVQILRFAEDGLRGRLSALGIIMIFISTTLVVIAARSGEKLTKVDK